MDEDVRAMLEATLRQPWREAEAARKRRFREKRREAGWQDQLVWLAPEGQAALAACRQPGETIDACLNRALVTLQRLLETGTSPVPSPVPSGTSPAPPETHPTHHSTQPGTSPVPSPVPSPAHRSMDDAALLARLQQAEHETPRPTYAALAAELGLPAGTVSRKAAAWITAGALQPRPLGGARPRRRRDAPT
jgi:hypothetical protein